MTNPSLALDRSRFSRRARQFIQQLKHGDEVAHLITFLAAASIIVVTFLVVYQLFLNSSLPRHKFGLGFFLGQTWDPVNGEFGALPFIYGTVVSSALALVLAVPLGVGAAIFLSELAPARLSNALTFIIELLAAVPSVIYGMLGIFILVPILRKSVMPFLKHTLGFLPLFQGPIYGVSLLAAGFVLAIMVVPFIISVSREVLMAVPVEQREAALALGATKWESTWQVVVPFARVGIMASIFLALARALGETMAVTMVIGGNPKISASLFSSGYSIAAVIADQFAEATGDLYVQTLIEMGLVLFLLTVLINGLARLVIIATTQKGAQAQ
jgi:phosphate transport system permease protein